MNDLVNWNMERIGVPVVKAFDISLPVGFSVRDTRHYHELFGKDVITNKKRISVGGAIISVLVNKMCNYKQDVKMSEDAITLQEQRFSHLGE